MEFYKEINQKRKKLNADTFSLPNIQPVDNLDDWNGFVIKFKELIKQKVENQKKNKALLRSKLKLRRY